MECEQTMSDNAHIVRDGIEPHPCTAEHFGVDDCQTCRNALAALDALVAERDELLRLWHCTPEDKAGMDANLLRVEAERDTANADWHRMRDLHADALTEVTRLTERVARELNTLEKWAGEQNAGNAFADQVRMWALSKRAALAPKEER